MRPSPGNTSIPERINCLVLVGIFSDTASVLRLIVAIAVEDDAPLSELAGYIRTLVERSQ